MKNKICLGCSEKFLTDSSNYRKKFCSRSCSTKYNNLIRSTAKICFCGLKIKDRNQDFCSRECKRNIRISIWLADNSDSPYNKHGGVPAFIEHWMVTEHEKKCCICGWNEVHPVSGNVVVEIDHIDGNYKNNRPENLRFLCPNHHALTPTYRGYNMGSGREFRKYSSNF